MLKNNEIGIYVHIPFCKKKCDYCDFISYCNKDNLIKDYVESLKIEIQSQNIKPEITTIYIGGGKIIHAENPSSGVTIDTINSGYYNKNYVGARRVI